MIYALLSKAQSENISEIQDDIKFLDFLGDFQFFVEFSRFRWYFSIIPFEVFLK